MSIIYALLRHLFRLLTCSTGNQTTRDFEIVVFGTS
jgi:hypothetical protein